MAHPSVAVASVIIDPCRSDKAMDEKAEISQASNTSNLAMVKGAQFVKWVIGYGTGFFVSSAG